MFAHLREKWGQMPGWVVHSPSDRLFDVGVWNCTLRLRGLTEEEEEERAGPRGIVGCPLISSYGRGLVPYLEKSAARPPHHNTSRLVLLAVFEGFSGDVSVPLTLDNTGVRYSVSGMRLVHLKDSCVARKVKNELCSGLKTFLSPPCPA